ncbi:sensor histidine kinase [Acidaminobacter sp. JC074]|uniref:sensor histidine kinase n=1 Tax=Acidaminobacter sp. JC074 TaxID=2530199 RepID=UPI001F0FE702|nr:GHKL domain-containing protein [Acidaminobacter sp. JC074]
MRALAKKYGIDSTIIKGLLSLFTFDAFLYLLWYIYIIPHEEYSERILTLLLVVCGVLPLLKLLSVFTIKRSFDAYKDQSIMRLQQETINEKKEKAKADITHIKMLLNNNRDEEAILYIEDTLICKNNQVKRLTDCITLDAIIGHYTDICCVHDIEFEVDVTPVLKEANMTSGVTQKILNTILGNLMDNSIDALKQTSNNKKKMSLEVTLSDYEIVYKVSNTGDRIDEIDKIFIPRYSTKGYNRGYGMVAVQRCVELLDGGIEVSSSHELTSFEVVIMR